MPDHIEQATAAPGETRVQDFLSPDQLASYLGVPLKTVYQWNTRQTGPKYYRIGRHVRYRPSDVEEWIEGCANG